MRNHIRWIFFKNEDLSELIRNDENNENWPGIETYVDITEKWWKIIDKQQIEINKIEIKNNKTKQLQADVRAWFVNEYNLLKKPAKRIWIEKTRELKRLEWDLKVYQNRLEHPKTELEEYEKQCLLGHIAIEKRKIGNCKDELKEAEEAYETEKRELCKRLAYDRDDLDPFLREPENWEMEKVAATLKILLRRVEKEKKRPPKTAFEWYGFWWKKYNDIHPSKRSDEPLQKLRSAIAKCHEHNLGNDVEKNPYEIWVEEKTDDSLIFVWELPEEELETVNEKGKIVKVKGQYSALIKNYFFNHYGEWYEVEDYHQVGYKLVVVSCRRSIFYNDYRHLIKSQGNVIVHHAPKTIASQEICSCPSYNVYTSTNTFDLDYELKFDCYRIGKDELKSCNIIKDEKGGAWEMIFGGVPKKVNINEEWVYITGELFPPEENRPNRPEGSSDSPPIRLPFPDPANDEQRRINEGYSNLSQSQRDSFGSIRMMGRAVNQTVENIGRGIKEFVVGKKSILYILLGKRLNGGVWQSTLFYCPTSKEEANSTPSTHDGKKMNLFFKRVGKYDNDSDMSGLTDETKEAFLEEKGLLKLEMHHFLRTHIEAKLKWRQWTVWKGNYWLIHNRMRITESISPSGTCITFEGSDIILGRVTELVSAKVGVDAQGFLSILVTTATTIAVGAATGGAGAGAAAAMATKAGAAIAGGLAQQAANELMNSPSYHESTQSMTISEFRHKFQHSKSRPISLELNYNQELANQYENKRELKGPMLYTYKNLGNIGKLFVQQSTDPNGHFIKCSVVSWNVARNSDWWRNGITEGRFIYHKNYLNFYQKELTGGKEATSRGGITRANWNEFVMMKSCGVKGGHDDISHLGGGFYMYKQKDGRPNFIRPRGTSHDFLPEIMNGLSARYPNLIVENSSSMWKLRHPEPTFSDYRFDIPDSYKNKTLEDGQRACDIEYSLRFFSGGDESLEGERYDITHIIVSKTATGKRGDILFNLIGEIVRRNRGGNAAGAPPATNLPTDPNSANIPLATPFNPNQFPSGGNLVPGPTGSGEFEPSVPDIDTSLDPDFDQSLDPDFDPAQDPETDPTKDPETPPDTPPDVDPGDDPD
ncbi:MAG: hypothetical protein I3273_06930 [Candidatus Moeniiplasma glomeromycotorum]|nr:hypothetical protein [Candidatus Moeniiplasma glomeromycotorum]MCE8168272.1 hypothetical protein [Candidatus Moeniiplasma glomeromycotorum]MCE8169820.1 hypothetical protein [Candidatus Moeniiplasma glomeromycotorum]